MNTALLRIAAVSLGLCYAGTSLAAYPDVSADHPQVRAITYLQTSGIMQGYPNGNFGPDLTLNRAELMKVLVEAKVGLPDSAQYSRCFPDVTDEWFAPYVCYAASHGWVAGYPDGTFKPSKAVNAVEATKMLVESRGYEIARFDWKPYGDVWFASYVETAMSRGVAVTDDREDFDKPYARQFVARMMYTALLSEAIVQFSFPMEDCAHRALVAVKATHDVSDVERYGISQDLIGIDAEGGTCVLVRDMNPYSGMNANAPIFSLTGIAPRLDTSDDWHFGDAPVVGGKVYFRAFCDCDGGSPDERWEYDIKNGTLSSFHAGIDLVTTDYRYFIDQSEQKIQVFDRPLRREAVIDVAWPSTFIRQNHGDGFGLGDYMEMGAMTLDGTKLRYEVYDSRPHAQGEAAAYTVSGVPTVDIATLFP